eukprot:834568-Prorocentrum_minimum.AAC.2
MNNVGGAWRCRCEPPPCLLPDTASPFRARGTTTRAPPPFSASDSSARFGFELVAGAVGYIGLYTSDMSQTRGSHSPRYSTTYARCLEALTPTLRVETLTYFSVGHDKVQRASYPPRGRVRLVLVLALLVEVELLLVPPADDRGAVPVGPRPPAAPLAEAAAPHAEAALRVRRHVPRRALRGRATTTTRHRRRVRVAPVDRLVLRSHLRVVAPVQRRRVRRDPHVQRPVAAVATRQLRPRQLRDSDSRLPPGRLRAAVELLAHEPSHSASAVDGAVLRSHRRRPTCAARAGTVRRTQRRVPTLTCAGTAFPCALHSGLRDRPVSGAPLARGTRRRPLRGLRRLCGKVRRSGRRGRG